jgi:hypothetical protein
VNETVSNADDGADERPSADELLLELMDLVQLAFPAAVSSMTVSFTVNEDGKRPALTDLDARADDGAPARPDLGHDDDRVLDAINALLTDLADATEAGLVEAGGARLLRGRIEARTGADRERDVVIYATDADATGDEGRKVVERRFDASELRWLLFTRELFAALNETEGRELEAKKALDSELRSYKKFAIDMSKGEITFTAPPDLTALATGGPDRAREGVTYRFELLGSHNEQTQRFLWGWANESAPAPFTRRVDAVRASSTGEGLRAFNEGAFGCPEKCADRLARHAAVRIADGVAGTKTAVRGVYRAGFKGRNPEGAVTSGFMYLALLASS